MKSLYESILDPDFAEKVETPWEKVKHSPNAIAIYKNLERALKVGDKYNVLLWKGKSEYLDFINQLISVGKEINPTRKTPKCEAMLVCQPKTKGDSSVKVDKYDYSIYYKTDSGKFHLLMIYPAMSGNMGEIAFGVFGDKKGEYYQVHSPMLSWDCQAYVLPESIKHIMQTVER